MLLPSLPFRRACSRPLLTAAALVAIALAYGGTVGCERHPAGHPAQGYGHGSARPGSKGGDKHGPDGKRLHYSDSQGTDIPNPHHHGHGGHGHGHGHGDKHHGAEAKGH